jgi:hypothetical protein
VGVYAATEVALDGQHRAAWVSTEGVYLTNGFTAQRITRDLDWDSTVDVASLGTAVLHWDKKRSALVLAYDSDGGGTNDRWLLLHMEELKEGGLPRISGPHYGAINCLTSGKVSGVRRLYSGHVSDGNVYLEDNGRTDASQAYSGTQVPTIVTWHQDWGANMVEVDTLRIGHADLGTGETATLAMTFERRPPRHRRVCRPQRRAGRVDADVHRQRQRPHQGDCGAGRRRGRGGHYPCLGTSAT